MAKNCIVPPAPDTNYTNVIGLDDEITLVLQKLDGMKQDIDKLFENLNKILFQLTQTSTQFEEFIKASSKQTKHENIPGIKPISNSEELQDLEFMLRDPDFRAELKNKIDVLCTKGKNRGTNNAYALIDVLIQRSFICQCVHGLVDLKQKAQKFVSKVLQLLSICFSQLFTNQMTLLLL